MVSTKFMEMAAGLDDELRAALLRSVKDTFQRVQKKRPSGIYFLFDRNELVYIGQAVDVTQRITGHILDPWKTFDSFAYHSVPAAKLNTIENACLETFWPTRYNRTARSNEPHICYSEGIRSSLLDTRSFARLCAI